MEEEQEVVVARNDTAGIIPPISVRAATTDCEVGNDKMVQEVGSLATDRQVLFLAPGFYELISISSHTDGH